MRHIVLADLAHQFDGYDLVAHGAGKGMWQDWLFSLSPHLTTVLPASLN
jgi:hypothetical protein